MPDFAQPPFAGAPEARFEPLPADGVLPEGFFSTSNLPTYVQVGGRWLMPDAAADGLRDRAARRRPRDHRAAPAAEGRPRRHGRGRGRHRGHRGPRQGFLGGGHRANEFRFMSTEVSRERPVNYEELARGCEEERRAAGTSSGSRARRWCTRAPAPISSGSSGTATCRRCCRERGGGARHRGGDLRHHPGHEQHRPADRGRPRPAHARHQPGAGGRLDRAR